MHCASSAAAHEKCSRRPCLEAAWSRERAEPPTAKDLPASGVCTEAELTEIYTAIGRMVASVPEEKTMGVYNAVAALVDEKVPAYLMSKVGSGGITVPCVFAYFVRGPFSLFLCLFLRLELSEAFLFLADRKVRKMLQELWGALSL